MNVRDCLLWVLVCGSLLGCQHDPAPIDYVARVGDQYLTQSELSDRLMTLQLGSDTAGARQQIIEQWVTDAVLYNEALRRDLPAEPGVRQTLEEQQRDVLVNELTARLYSGEQVAISDADIQAYFERHREELRLREPFVHVLYLTTRSLAAANAVREGLPSPSRANASQKDWDSLITEYAVDPAEARTLSARYYAEGQLFRNLPPLRAQLQRLRAGETAPIFEMGGLYHVLHVGDRVEAGSIPEPAWVEPEIRRRLELRARKQMYAREVERLRSEALARDELDIR
jgi:hypothetical protein